MTYYEKTKKEAFEASINKALSFLRKEFNDQSVTYVGKVNDKTFLYKYYEVKCEEYKSVYTLADNKTGITSIVISVDGNYLEFNY